MPVEEYESFGNQMTEKDPFDKSRLGHQRQPLERPLRLTSKNKWMEDKVFTIDEQGTQKVLRGCTEEERQYVLESGWDIFARTVPRNYLAERLARARKNG
jgi:hypothetical protein